MFVWFVASVGRGAGVVLSVDGNYKELKLSTLRLEFLDDALQMYVQEIGCMVGNRLGRMCGLSEDARSNTFATSVLAELKWSGLLRRWLFQDSLRMGVALSYMRSMLYCYMTLPCGRSDLCCLLVSKTLRVCNFRDMTTVPLAKVRCLQDGHSVEA